MRTVRIMPINTFPQLATSQPQGLLGPRRRELARISLIALAHIPLGLLLYASPSIGIIHPAAAFLVGMYFSLRKGSPRSSVAVVTAYIIGSEVLWRMAKVPIYWEFGKYGIAAIMLTAIIVRRDSAVPKLPLLYGLLLLPACLITIMAVDFGEARAMISANMSGPLALVVACWFFSSTRLSLPELQRVLYAIIIPLISVAFATLFHTMSVEDIQFTTESNFATSGGFGPNQVSSMLGLGVFLAAGCLISFKSERPLRLALGGIALLCATQSVLTFSRGGMYTALGALAIMVVLSFRNISDGLMRLVPLAILAVVFLWFLFPILNNFTGGKLEERFGETDTTNRADLIWSDLEIFRENPILGVGVGISRTYRERFLTYSSASHTEFSRLLSDHGVFGLTAAAVLLVIVFVNLKRARSTLHRAVVASLAVWCALYMLNAGMRLAAPSFLWGLACVTIVARRRPRRLVNPQPPVKDAAISPTQVEPQFIS